MHATREAARARAPPSPENGLVTGQQVFRAVLERDVDGTWWFVHVPTEVRRAFRHLERRGHVPVRVTIGGSSWAASLMPWADGSAQVVVDARVRAREGLALGDELEVLVEPRP